MKLARVALLPCLALAGCLDEKPARIAAPSLPDPACFPADWHFAFLATGTDIYRQGAVVPIAPSVDKSPAGTAELPLRCTSGWSVTGPATLSADRTSVAIAGDAPAGATVTIVFHHAGKPVETRFQIVSRDEIVLTGRWSQRSLEGCAAPEPVRELEFRPGNRFSVTFVPFETYRDYWGTYAWDADTGRLRLTVEGGNFVPPNLDPEGAAELKEGRLRLTGLFLGSRDGAPRSGCTYIF
ncbi:MAG TPA: hypothetical protein VEW26_03230 [Allosphingosinicella sp.]|nr:hypothetical protein [Allosphingosinicella sp.]